MLIIRKHIIFEFWSLSFSVIERCITDAFNINFLEFVFWPRKVFSALFLFDWNLSFFASDWGERGHKEEYSVGEKVELEKYSNKKKTKKKKKKKNNNTKQ